MTGSRFWRRYFEVYDTLNLFIPYQELLKIVCDELDIRPGDRVLEAGCGTGNLAIKIKEKGGDVVGLDNCKEALDLYREKDRSANVILADLTQKLPFPDEFFDKIACSNTLYAIPKEKQLFVLKEFYRVLRHGGRLVLVNPKKESKTIDLYVRGIRKNFREEGFFKTLYKIIKLSLATLKILYYNECLLKKEKRFHFFEEKEQESLLKKAGFEEILSVINVYEEQDILVCSRKR